MYSGIENEDEIYSCAQLEACEERNNNNSIKTNNANKNDEKEQENACLKKVKLLPSNNNNNNNTTCKSPLLTKTNNINIELNNCVKVLQTEPKQEDENNKKVKIDDIQNGANTKTTNNSENNFENAEKENRELVVSSALRRPPPRSVTASIFAASKQQHVVDKDRVKCEVEPLLPLSQSVLVPPVPPPQQQALPKRGVSSTKLIFNRPQPATAKIFAPRTEDMNKGFLTFADDESGLTSEYQPISITL